MPKLILPVLAMSGLITAADALFSEAKAAPIAEAGGSSIIAPSEEVASEGGLGATRIGK